eukprot:Gregarina_sp_Poly_1__1181@NODE_128_length_13277_cov_115_450643_g114_i0_p12_GENE_NODE_128_length_13277_cov_115_450643_g114_i0NODE_128_length_13277_cov_115_450643_g114_i0_p12_ORF_typecomplete_len131_score5_02Dus/PF01207_17/1_9e34ScsC_N/PF18312_1/1_1e02ScsC_N/PF18312_1/0_63DHO_dh/PF01180_21/0_03_NODE_128_length_13277_cov_115_450643_g114_i084908882
MVRVDAWTFWTQVLKSPRFVMGPMVNQSELQYRILVSRYGVQLSYSPMMHARLFATDAKYRDKIFQSRPSDVDRPIVAQLCGSDPEVVVKAGALLQDHVDAIDLNCGCPQGIAKRGKYGAYLLSNPELIV